MPPESAYFLQVNRGKRSLTLDFKKEAGKEVLRALIKDADVLVRPISSLQRSDVAEF